MVRDRHVHSGCELVHKSNRLTAPIVHGDREPLDGDPLVIPHIGGWGVDLARRGAHLHVLRPIIDCRFRNIDIWVL